MIKLTLDKKEIENYQQNRDPYLMIDYATEVVPGVSSIGYKKLTKMAVQRCVDSYQDSHPK